MISKITHIIDINIINLEKLFLSGNDKSLPDIEQTNSCFKKEDLNYE